MTVLQALERALRTGTVLLTAAQADALWSVGCGDAIEDAKQAINRYTAMYIYELLYNMSPQGITCVKCMKS